MVVVGIADAVVEGAMAVMRVVTDGVFQVLDADELEQLERFWSESSVWVSQLSPRRLLTPPLNLPRIRHFQRGHLDLMSLGIDWLAQLQ